MALEENEFEQIAAKLLAAIADRLGDEDALDVELQGSVLTIKTEAGKTFVLNKHAPLRQMWLSSPVSGAAHFDYDRASGAWRSTRGGGDLAVVLAADLARAADIQVAFP